MNLKSLILGLVILLAAAFLAYLLWPGDERAIRRQLAVIESAGSKEPGETPVEALLKVRELARLCTDPCRLRVDAAGIAGDVNRRQLTDRLSLVRAAYSRTTVNLHDISIDLTGDGTALARATLRLQGERGGEPVADVHEVEAGLGKIDGTWLLTEIRLVEVLER